MASEVIEGIVLQTNEWKEHDLLVKVFSKEHGLINLKALGVRKATSKNKASVQLYSYSEFEIYRARFPEHLSKLKTGQLIKPLSLKMINQELSLYFDLFANLTIEWLGWGSPHSQAFALWKNVVSEVIYQQELLVVINFCLFTFANFLGHQWVLKACVKCNSSADIKTFSLAEGGFICKHCVTHTDYLYRLSLLKILWEWDSFNNNPLFLKEKHYNHQDMLFLINLLLLHYEQNIGIASYFVSNIKLHSVYWKAF